MAAPLTAAALIAQQVGGNAIRDGLFLTLFPVQSLPYFIAGTAVWPSAPHSSRTAACPARPSAACSHPLASNAALFLVEWALLGWQPRAAAALLYIHSSVLGGIAISAFWSLLNERFDPHSAKPLMARVAAAATFGGFVGGVSAERVVALFPEGAFLPVLGLVSAGCVAGAVVVGRGAPASRDRGVGEPEREGLWAQFQRQPLLRDLALVVASAAMLAALADYVLKAEAVGYFGKVRTVRFFGLFYP